MKKEIDENTDEQKSKLDEQRPKLPLYEDLSDKQKKMVFKEGEKVFDKQIKEHQDDMMKEMGGKLNPDNYLGRFKGIVPTSSLDGIVEGAKSKF